MGYYDDSYVQDLEDEVSYLRELVATQERTISGLDKEVSYLDRTRGQSTSSLNSDVKRIKRSSGKKGFFDRVSLTITPGRGFDIQIED